MGFCQTWLHNKTHIQIIVIIVAVRAPNCHHSIDNNFVAFRHCMKFKNGFSLYNWFLKIHFKNYLKWYFYF